jgi:hypothetical protein
VRCFRSAFIERVLFIESKREQTTTCACENCDTFRVFRDEIRELCDGFSDVQLGSESLLITALL